jgi:drug/metabolite transporter (DMT)-like permease
MRAPITLSDLRSYRGSLGRESGAGVGNGREDRSRSRAAGHAGALTTAGAAAAAPSEQRRGQVFVALAAIAWSTAGVLQRQLTVGAATQVAGRAAFAFAALAAYVLVAERRGLARAGPAGAGFAACIAVASGAFIVALNRTTVAHVLFIQAVAPVLAALLGRVTLGEPIALRTAAAMAVALAGVALMVGGAGGGGLVGDGLCLLMALAFAGAIVIARHRRDVSMAPATCLAQLLLVAAFAPFAHFGALTGGDLVTLAALGAGQIGLGLVFLTIGARLIPAAQVAVITLLEVVLGPLWVWLAIGERPGGATLVGGVVVIGAVVLQVSGDGLPRG